MLIFNPLLKLLSTQAVQFYNEWINDQSRNFSQNIINMVILPAGDLIHPVVPP